MTESTKNAIHTMDSLLNELLGNAEALLEQSIQDAKAETLEILQQKQQTIIEKLIEADQVLQNHLKSDHQGSFNQQLESLQTKISSFEELNQKFITNLTMRRSLIHFELQDIRKSRNALSKVKAAYIAKTSGKRPKSPSINTLS